MDSTRIIERHEIASGILTIQRTRRFNERTYSCYVAQHEIGQAPEYLVKDGTLDACIMRCADRLADDACDWRLRFSD